jgi:hypothetical protein
MDLPSAPSRRTVVGIADDDHVAFGLPPPVADPEVKHVVQVDVR